MRVTDDSGIYQEIGSRSAWRPTHTPAWQREVPLRASFAPLSCSRVLVIHGCPKRSRRLIVGAIVLLGALQVSAFASSDLRGFWSAGVGRCNTAIALTPRIGRSRVLHSETRAFACVSRPTTLQSPSIPVSQASISRCCVLFCCFFQSTFS